MNTYRVWPDGTIQNIEEEPYHWMSDDYIYVDAYSEEEVIRMIEHGGLI